MNQQIALYRQKIAELEQKIIELNPFANLKALSNKEFGEGFSENYILEHCPSLSKDNTRGHDFFHPTFNRIEVKSTRLPCGQITYNQCHLDEADYYLFVQYDTDEGTVNIYFVPTTDLLDDTKFSKSLQHTRNLDERCYTISGSSQKNKNSFQNYYFASFEEFNKYLEEHI